MSAAEIAAAREGEWAIYLTEEKPTPRDRFPADPVSYTHLRAHETVLDLVCRLLLEKKKHYVILHNLIT